MNTNIWNTIKDEVKLRIGAEPSLEPYLNQLILSQKNLTDSVASVLASKLNSDALSSSKIKEFILDVYKKCDHIEDDLINDLIFFKDHDPACKYFSTPILFYKGFQGLATYRAAHCLWNDNRHTMALFFQNRASEIFGVDIHPAAKISGGVMIDHATGVVIGETSVIDENVSIYQGVTLGGKGFENGDRHPKIKSGVSIFASSTILGNITIEKNAKVAAGSLVLKDVKKNTTVAGIPAKEI
ncbi:MAG: serine O-acetyltransferase EpsC [Pseudomonadota bacterium]|jgi:serine O-acetyltransferase|nr:serine O-acetyltransferase EpsC [Pseudomonadota bacterium]|tara:strand:+ start:559 stop:1281 length:723 start_codon:yes stop_codon:yes gene_type:complete